MTNIHPNTPAFLCEHIFENSKPILYVCKADGDWQFLCGGDHPSGSIPCVVGIGHILDRDTTLWELMGLEDDYEAERKEVGGSWEIRKC